MERFLKRLFSLLVLLFCSVPAYAAVWTSSHEWNDEAERRYSHWISTTFGETFFVEGKWGGIETDCADAVYASRIIFSYENELPFALPTSVDRLRSYSNLSNEFDSISDPVKRVRAFIEKINDKTWTGALAKHTYPIELSRQTVVPGTIWLKPGHVEIVRAVEPDGNIQLVGSWLPAAIRRLITISTLGYIPRDDSMGFRRWIWPQNIAKPLSEQPEFKPQAVEYPGLASVPSVESKISHLELNRHVSDYESYIRSKLRYKDARLNNGGVVESAGRRAARLANDFCKTAHARAEVVGQGRNYYATIGRCMNKSEYHLYSTPSRDSNLRRIVIGLGVEFENRLAAVDSALAACPPIQVEVFRTLEVSGFLRNLIRLDFSSDPHESVDARFGLANSQGDCTPTY